MSYTFVCQIKQTPKYMPDLKKKKVWVDIKEFSENRDWVQGKMSFKTVIRLHIHIRG